MTRILYLSTSSTVGGAEKTLYTLATLLNPEAFRVVGVISLKPKGAYASKLEAAGHAVHSLGLSSWPGLRGLQRAAAIIARSRPDIVHAFMYQAMQAARLIKRLGWAEFKLVSSPRVHYRTRPDYSLWIDRALKSSDDLLVSECDASRNYLAARQGYDPTKMTTLYNGVDIASWPVSKVARGELRRKLRLAPQDLLVGSVGRLDEQKGHRFLLEAIASLRDRHPIRGVLIGDGPLKPKLEALAKKLRVQDHVHLAGEQDDIPAWLSAMDVFALPSLWEGLPNSLLEAMGMGLPVVATRVDGVPEVVQPDATGILCDPGDPRTLAVGIQDLFLDPALRQRLGSGAQKMISERFKLADMLQSYEAVYARLAAE